MCEIEGEQKPERSKAPPQKRRAVIRVESAETQDCVSGQQAFEAFSQEQTEELGFVPSAVSGPQWALQMCDNRCREESFSFFHLAAILTEEGAAYTINRCKQCYNEERLRPGAQFVKAAQWRGAHAAPQGTCDNLVNSLKLLTNQQKDGGSPVDKIVTGLLEQSRKGVMDGLRKFIAADNHEAVKVGGLRQGIQSFKVVKLKFTADFPGAIIRERAGELDTASRRRCTAHLDGHHQCGGPAVGAPASRCRLACLLPGHLPEGQAREAMYNDYKKTAPGCEDRKAWGKSKGESFVGHESGKRERRII